jgi:hypothetical protein
MKIIIDIMELYEDIREIPKNEFGAYFDEKAIIRKALEYLNYKYFPAYSPELLVTNPKINYLSFSNEYPSRIPDKIVFIVNPA